MQDYPKEVAAYTKGFGRIFLTLDGYAPCHNAAEVIDAIGYDAEHDTANPSGSVFCAHGAGFTVPWNEVKEHMHVEGWQPETVKREELPERATRSVMDEWIGVDEVDAILEKTLCKQRRSNPQKRCCTPAQSGKSDGICYQKFYITAEKTGISAGGRLQYHLCLG